MDLKGGYIIIDISSLALAETEEATAIEDEGILKQLLSLSDIALHSDRKLKPIYLRAIDSNGVEVVSLCELDRNNGILRIKAFIMDIVLTIYVAYDIDIDTQEVLIDSASYEVISEANKTIKEIESAEELHLSGDFTAPSIIEDMDGYEFVEGASTNYTYNYTYAGVVKTGNKITFVLALQLTRQADAGDTAILGNFNIPADILAKLYSNPILTLDSRTISYFSSTYAKIDNIAYTSKVTNGIQLVAVTNNFVVGTTYFVRYEVTFLLSDSLIS